MSLSRLFFLQKIYIFAARLKKRQIFPITEKFLKRFNKGSACAETPQGYT